MQKPPGKVALLPCHQKRQGGYKLMLQWAVSIVKHEIHLVRSLTDDEKAELPAILRQLDLLD